MLDPIVPARRARIHVPGGTQRPPWLQPPRPRPPVHYARTWVAASGPELLRAADAAAGPPSLASPTRLRATST